MYFYSWFPFSCSFPSWAIPIFLTCTISLSFRAISLSYVLFHLVTCYFTFPPCDFKWAAIFFSPYLLNGKFTCLTIFICINAVLILFIYLFMYFFGLSSFLFSFPFLLFLFLSPSSPNGKRSALMKDLKQCQQEHNNLAKYILLFPDN